MDAATISALIQVPLVGAFLLYTLHARKLDAEERRAFNEGWQKVISQHEASRDKSEGAVTSALEELGKTHSAAFERLSATQLEACNRLVAGQAKLSRQQAKIAAMLIVQLGHAEDVTKARDLIREMLEPG